MLFVASTARADDSGGEAWLECYVGRGGLDSPQAVYERVVQAITRDDAAALAVLLPDRCNALRAFDQLGPDALRHIGALMKADGWPERIAALRTFVAAEGGSLPAIAVEPYADTAGFDDAWPDATVVSSVGTNDVTFEVSTLDIDGRWFLWNLPRFSVTPEAKVIAVYQRLATRIGERLRQVDSPGAADAVVANWLKADHRPIAHVKAALLLLQSDAMLQADARKAMAHVGLGVGFSFGSVPSGEVFLKLLQVFPEAIRPLGNATCDDYFAMRFRCIDEAHHDVYETQLEVEDLRAQFAEGDGEAAEQSCRERMNEPGEGCPGGVQ